MLVNFYKTIALSVAVATSVSAVQLEAEEETSLANSYLDDYVHDLAETYSMPTPDEFSQIYGDLEEDDDDSDSDSDDDDDDDNDDDSSSTDD